MLEETSNNVVEERLWTVLDFITVAFHVELASPRHRLHWQQLPGLRSLEHQQVSSGTDNASREEAIHDVVQE